MAHRDVRNIAPLSTDRLSFAWDCGTFDSGARPYTEHVEGVICTSHHLVLVTLEGGAEHQHVHAACGHRYEGKDRKGVVSFVPAYCERWLTMRGVDARWASISLSPALFDGEMGKASPIEISTFTNREDPFLSSLVAEVARLLEMEGGVQHAYCETMSAAMSVYLMHRYGQPGAIPLMAPSKLPAWRLRRIEDYVDQHIASDIRIAHLAELVGLSEGHFHRAFRETTGKTPLAYINEMRIQRAMHILANEIAPITDVALRVGFPNASHFTRTFRRYAGVNPSYFRGARTSRSGHRRS